MPLSCEKTLEHIGKKVRQASVLYSKSQEFLPDASGKPWKDGGCILWVSDPEKCHDLTRKDMDHVLLVKDKLIESFENKCDINDFKGKYGNFWEKAESNEVSSMKDENKFLGYAEFLDSKIRKKYENHWKKMKTLPKNKQSRIQLTQKEKEIERYNYFLKDQLVEYWIYNEVPLNCKCTSNFDDKWLKNELKNLDLQ